MPTVYEQGIRRDLADSEYRDWLKKNKYLTDAETRHGKGYLPMDDAGRAAAKAHIFEGQYGMVEMAIPMEQLPEYVEDNWVRTGYLSQDEIDKATEEMGEFAA